MNTSSPKTSLQVGQDVRIEGASQEWMQPFVRRIATIGEIKQNPNVTAYRVDGLSGGPLWYPAACLSVVEEEGVAS